MTPNKRFGALLSEGLISVAKRQSKQVVAVEQEVAEQIGFSHHTVERWRRGHVPRESAQLATLVQYCVTHGRVDQDWAQSVARQARYPDAERLIQSLFVERPTPPARLAARHNLPPRYGDFLGRTDDLARVLEGLASRWPIIAIEGFGGMGKTTLAIEAAQRCLAGAVAPLDRAFAAVVWVSAKDRPEQSRWLDTVLDTIARVLDSLYILQLAPAHKATEVDALLRSFRTLVILDNFETIEDEALVKWIQDVPEPSKALITTRYAQMRRVWDIHLEGLPEAEALELIRRHAQRLSLRCIQQADAQATLPLTRVVAGNPKAIELALGHVKYSGLTLDEVVDHLHVASQTVNDVFAYLLTQAWAALVPSARQLLLVVPFFATTPCKEALGAGAALGGYQLDQALGQLVEMSLLEPNDAPGQSRHRYGAHPLTRAFAHARLAETPPWEKVARRRWITWYCAFVSENGGEDWDNWAQYALLAEERENILQAAEWCYTTDDLPSLWTIALECRSFFKSTGYWLERERLFRWSLALAQRRQADAIIAEALTHLSWTLFLTYRLGEARDVLCAALARASTPDQRRLQAEIVVHQAYLEEFDQQYELAEQLNRQGEALLAAYALGDRRRERLLIQIRYQQGRIAYALQRWDEAQRHFEEVYARGAQARWERAVIVAANGLGDIAMNARQFTDARRWYDQAERLNSFWADRRRAAHLQFSEARLAAAAGDIEAARKLTEIAFDQFHSLDMRQEAEQALAWMTRLECDPGAPLLIP